MPAFTIFLDQWPWIAAYLLIALGAYMLIFGRQHFERVVRVLSAVTLFAIISCLLSINGYFESKIEEGPTAGTVLTIIVILLLGTVLGFMFGAAMPSKFSLVFICILDAVVLSMVIYSFLMSFTGTWVVLLINTLLFGIVCVLLPLKYE